MEDVVNQDVSQGQSLTDELKGWMMVALTLIFVFLYAAALFGWLKPLADITMISRLEPIIFVIIGYYFGRFPAQQTEKTLKGEINRQIQKADAAQHIKEKTLQERDVLEEKIKNARTTLVSSSCDDSFTTAAAENSMGENIAFSNNIAQHSIETAVNILSS